MDVRRRTDQLKKADGRQFFSFEIRLMKPLEDESGRHRIDIQSGDKRTDIRRNESLSLTGEAGRRHSFRSGKIRSSQKRSIDKRISGNGFFLFSGIRPGRQPIRRNERILLSGLHAVRSSGNAAFIVFRLRFLFPVFRPRFPFLVFRIRSLFRIFFLRFPFRIFRRFPFRRFRITEIPCFFRSRRFSGDLSVDHFFFRQKIKAFDDERIEGDRTHLTFPVSEERVFEKRDDRCAGVCKTADDDRKDVRPHRVFRAHAGRDVFGAGVNIVFIKSGDFFLFRA